MHTLPTYTVFGHPIAHSKSPIIHQLFAQQEGIKIEYTRTLVEAKPSAFKDAVTRFFQIGHGANVTLPFKTWAYELSDELSERARAAGAVNTLIYRNQTLIGDNTDGQGLVLDLCQHHHIDLRDKNILILGAGGAARGIILPLMNEQVANITLANRTHEKALLLAQQFSLSAVPYAQLSGSFDLIINATSGSVSGDVPAVSDKLFSGCLMAYDLFYAQHATAFMRFAQQAGAKTVADGLGMLVGQAAESYRLWRGFSPNCALVIEALRAQ